jgi:hypothetical protein
LIPRNLKTFCIAALCVSLLFAKSIFASTVLVTNLNVNATDEQNLNRLKEIDHALEKSYQAANTWGWVWGISFGVGTVGQLALIPVLASDKTYNSTPDLLIGGIESFVAILPVLIAPPKVLRDYPILHRKLAGGTEASTELLMEAQRVLRDDATDQRDCASWVMHVINVGLSLATGALLGFGFQHWPSAALNTCVGFAIGEVFILTQPTDLIQAEKIYHEKYRATLNQENHRPTLSFKLNELELHWAI